MAVLLNGFRLNRKYRWVIKKIVLYFVLTSLALLFLIPFFWMISSSLKTREAIFTFPPQFIPHPVIWSNYIQVMQKFPFAMFFLNSTIITVSNIIGYILSCSLVAYGLARFRVRGTNVILIIIVATMVIPLQVLIVPLFVIFKSLHWIDTWFPLIIPSFFGNAFFIFLLRQFFMSIPKELEDAARIDGCSYLGILWRIILPLSKPALATVAVFAFMFHWNDFFLPLIVLNTQSKYTVALGLMLYSTPVAAGSGAGPPLPQLLMAASFIALIPNIIVFMLAQKLFVKGMILSGMKM
ncbi:MAG: carbohydrate ABC transporter permease [Actinobacteria bacterium]|nr:carbohydrate ABC transporter permease [Actinomycetota bacterium]